jgi:dynein light chain roadblock-type
MQIMTTELEERFQELSSAKTVRGCLILNGDGAPIKTSLDAKTTESYGTILHEIVTMARRLFLEQDPNNDLSFMRFRLKKHEIMVAPDKQFLLVVIHHPQE